MRKPVVVEFERNEYRLQGEETHRRPNIEGREWRTPIDGAWLVIPPGQVPNQVKRHFTQARNQAPVMN